MKYLGVNLTNHPYIRNSCYQQSFGWVAFSRGLALRENWLSLSQQLAKANSPLVTDGTHPQFLSSCWVFTWYGLDWLRAFCQCLWVHLCSCSAVSSRPCFLVVIHYRQLSHSFCPFFAMIPEPWQGMWWICSIRPEHSVISCSLALDQLWISVLITTHCNTLMGTEWYIILWV